MLQNCSKVLVKELIFTNVEDLKPATLVRCGSFTGVFH